MIDAFGGDARRKKFLPKLCTHGAFRQLLPDRAGRRLRCREPHDARAPRRRHYVLDGTKAFISGGGVSDVYVVMARTGEAGPRGISCIVVEKGTPGLSYGAQEKKLGWKSQPTAMVMFENCRVPAANLIGREGQGFKIAMAGLDGGRLNIGACSIGGAQFCLDRTIDYMNERKQFGSRLADFQALQFRIADYATELEAARLMLHRAAVAVGEGEPGGDAARRAGQAACHRYRLRGGQWLPAIARRLRLSARSSDRARAARRARAPDPGRHQRDHAADRQPRRCWEIDGHRCRMPAADILFERRGAAGLVTLNRPQALNAVTHGMVRGACARSSTPGPTIRRSRAW